jgi:uncharacterized repeat protein (TIGR03803 family)
LDGSCPRATLVQATDGNFYGTTLAGGAAGSGTVFKITPDGALTTLYSFSCLCADGMLANGLVQATDGNFYGTTGAGGAHGSGTVFKISATGTLTTLHSFSCPQGSECPDGAGPYAGLVQATGGDFYGTTAGGGINYHGTIFKITASGALTPLYSFCPQSGCLDGDAPEAGLVQATDGSFYGTTVQGGTDACPSGCGTIFKVTPAGSLTTLHSFCQHNGCPDGFLPFAGLVQATDGDLYGTTYSGGTSDMCEGTCGTVFRLSVGLGPFVETEPAAGQLGAVVKILGTDLTGVSRVTFNGTPAVFAVSSRSKVTEITTTVPAGATTGEVQVVIPSGTLSSNVPFRVLP